MPGVDLPIPFEAYTGGQPYIFVSYAHADGKGVFPLITALHRAGYRLWYDEGIDPGNEWPEEIAKALEGAQCFVVFISRRSVESSNVRNEINFALSRAKPFLAIYLEEVALPPGLELRMSWIQAVHRWRMTDEQYQRKLSKALPAETLASAAPPDAARTPAEPSPRPVLRSAPAMPFLVLGLGGTGIKVVSAVKRRLVSGGDSWRASIRLLCVDTDDYRGDGFDRTEWIYLQARNVGECICSDAISPWWIDYAPLNAVGITHGSGGIREAARLALFVSVESFFARVKNTVVELGCVPLAEAADKNAPPRLHAIVIASLAGGTGSGLFFDIPGLIEMAAGAPCAFTAIFVMPWVFRDLAACGYANTYAALLELAHLMDSRTKPTTIRYARQVMASTRAPLYDTVYLVDGFADDGAHVPSIDFLADLVAQGTLPVLTQAATTGEKLSFGSDDQQLHTVVIDRTGFTGSVAELPRMREEYRSARTPLHTAKSLTRWNWLQRRYGKRFDSR